MRDLETYKNWTKKNRCSRFTMLSSMRNDLIGQFEVHTTVKEIWDALRAAFTCISATRLRKLRCISILIKWIRNTQWLSISERYSNDT